MPEPERPGQERADSLLTRRRLLGGAAGFAALTSFGVRADARSGPAHLRDSATATEPAVRLGPQNEPVSPGSYRRGSLYIALYGFPGSRTLGALGEQGIPDSLDRVRRTAQPFTASGRTVVPTFEILGSVASSVAGSDGDYSNEFDTERFTPWIDAAGANDMHVVIDLQSGRSRFPDQSKEYRDVLRHPNVSLGLDPEWRVDAPGRPGGGRVGTVDGSEVNETIDWLDALIREERLPPKMLVVHQFTPSMVTNKSIIRGTSNVDVVFHMDGFGSLAVKRGSWNRMVADLPPGALTGWKNFYDEDRPTPTPAQTLDNQPTPMLITYQ